jgi:hypothetical protein
MPMASRSSPSHERKRAFTGVQPGKRGPATIGLSFSLNPESPMRVVLPVLLIALSSGCTFVHMAPGASSVRVVSGPPAGCESRGEVEVSVKDSLGPYERNPLRVREELETLARNEAPGLGADTVQPVGPPTAGAQRFNAWKCGR